MKINTVWAVYFSPTDTTKKMVTTAANAAAEAMQVPVKHWDITLPAPRKAGKEFGEGDLVILGTPVYAGRVPNVILKDLALLQGNGAIGVPVNCFGNRNFDNALIELRDIMENQGFHTVAAAAFSCEHSFSRQLGAGRPDDKDFQTAFTFGWKLGYQVEILLKAMRENPEVGWTYPSVEVPGIPETYGGYYQPRDRHGNPIDIRKVKPLTGDNCNGCGLCAEICPMGSIDPKDVRQFTGICIKCGACIKKCPQGAKYYEDPGYLYHKTELEEMYTRRAEPEVFFME
ncbi:MAG: 4Fe-4S binding protein [Firmicutes bacterium]|nr:4Fe-4S binding protein [Bacillota bacterium]